MVISERKTFSPNDNLPFIKTNLTVFWPTKVRVGLVKAIHMYTRWDSIGYCLARDLNTTSSCTENRELSWCQLCRRWLHQRRQSWHHDNSWFSVMLTRSIIVTQHIMSIRDRLSQMACATTANTWRHKHIIITSQRRLDAITMFYHPMIICWDTHNRRHALIFLFWSDLVTNIHSITENIYYQYNVSSNGANFSQLWYFHNDGFKLMRNITIIDNIVRGRFNWCHHMILALERSQTAKILPCKH